MVNVLKLLSGDTINIEVVRASASKKLVIVNEGQIVQTFGKDRLKVLVEFDGQQKFWYPNVQSLKNLAREYGVDSKHWVGKPIEVRVENLRGKDCVLAKFVPLKVTCGNAAAHKGVTDYAL